MHRSAARSRVPPAGEGRRKQANGSQASTETRDDIIEIAPQQVGVVGGGGLGAVCRYRASRSSYPHTTRSPACSRISYRGTFPSSAHAQYTVSQRTRDRIEALTEAITLNGVEITFCPCRVLPETVLNLRTLIGATQDMWRETLGVRDVFESLMRSATRQRVLRWRGPPRAACKEDATQKWWASGSRYRPTIRSGSRSS